MNVGQSLENNINHLRNQIQQTLRHIDGDSEKGQLLNPSTALSQHSKRNSLISSAHKMHSKRVSKVSEAQLNSIEQAAIDIQMKVVEYKKDMHQPKPSIASTNTYISQDLNK